MSDNGRSYNRYKAHQNLVKQTKLDACDKYRNLRLHDRHVGKFLPLVFIKKVIRGECKIHDWPRFVVAINKKGMADLYGYISLHNILIHIEAEAKTGNAVQTKEQKQWQQHIEKLGGCYILFRSSEDFLQQLEHYLRDRKLL